MYWRLSPNAHIVRDACDDYARHNGNGFWPRGEEPTSSHPGSQPDLEGWYNDTARPFLERPALKLEGLSGGGGLGSSGGGGSGGAGGGGRSNHPADRLIRELIDTRRDATSQEITVVLERMSKADFPTGKPHLAKRVLRDAQWIEGTTPEEYLDDLRRLVLQPSSWLGIYRRRGGTMAAVIGSTLLAVASERLGRQWERLSRLQTLLLSISAAVRLSVTWLGSRRRIAS